MIGLPALRIGVFGGRRKPDGQVTQAAGQASVSIVMRGSGPLKVDWGDGSTSDYTLSDSNTTVSKTYADTTTAKTIRFYGGNIYRWESTSVAHYGGDVALLPVTLTRLDVRGSNTLTGDVSGLPSGLTFLIVYGSNTLTGDVSVLPSGLTYLIVTGSNTLAAPTASAPSGLCFFRIDTVLSETSVNNILAAFWSNRDAPKPRSEREIQIDFSTSAAPTGQGITDKANLQAYRSPNNDAAFPLWTVLTN